MYNAKNLNVITGLNTSIIFVAIFMDSWIQCGTAETRYFYKRISALGHPCLCYHIGVIGGHDMLIL